MHAVISDIHGNLPALQAVLADIEQKGIGRAICLGDVVGYGPRPARCVVEQAVADAERIADLTG